MLSLDLDRITRFVVKLPKRTEAILDLFFLRFSLRVGSDQSIDPAETRRLRYSRGYCSSPYLPSKQMIGNVLVLDHHRATTKDHDLFN